MKVCPQCTTGYSDSHTTCPTHGVTLNEIRDLKPGMVIRGSYRIVRKLGQGGMGSVYLAQHTLIDEPRALKFLSPELANDPSFTSRFLREVRTLRLVRNRNVVDCGDPERAEDDSLFFPMEFVDGPDLRDFLQDCHPERSAAELKDLRLPLGALPVELALSIARGIAEGLGAAHAKGMVHRDIKPENILMAREEDSWVPKIADFGIVATKESSTAYTKTGGTLLTMAYAAPEQWTGMRAAELDGRTDLYALGGVLFEMLTGQTVFDAESYEGWAEQHKNAAPRPPSALRPELADWKGLDALVLRLLAKDRDLRPHDVSEVLWLLDEVVYVPPMVRRITQSERLESDTSRSVSGVDPVWGWVALVVLLGALTFTVARFSGSQPAGDAPQSATATGPAVQPQAAPTQQPASPANPRSSTAGDQQKPAQASGQTWTDPATGLMWTKQDGIEDLFKWNDAVSYCKNLRLGGYSDWRLPSIEELAAIYDPRAKVPGKHPYEMVAYHVKGNLKLTACEWSSSQGSSPSEKWTYNFNDSDNRYSVSIEGGECDISALCVRRSGN
jgi:serine/threonine-protein kinase